MGFTEPSRSPGLLVSSYLAVSPLPRPGRKHPDRGGLFSVALSLSEATVKHPRTVGVTHHRALRSPDFPPRHVPRLEPSKRFPARHAQIKAPRRSSRPPRTSTYTVRRGGPPGNLERPAMPRPAPPTERLLLDRLWRFLGRLGLLPLLRLRFRVRRLLLIQVCDPLLVLR